MNIQESEQNLTDWWNRNGPAHNAQMLHNLVFKMDWTGALIFGKNKFRGLYSFEDFWSK